MYRSALTSLALVCTLGCDAGEEVDPFSDAQELDLGPALGKNDSAGVAGLPVKTFADTQVWDVVNQWEDTDTARARGAGIAWEADSGLNWDQKYAKWIASMQQIDGTTVDQTFELTTPWGKSFPAPKLDCADVALMLRMTFAAWYQLPYFITMFDKGKPIYFGHFGIRTETGIWNSMPRFKEQYKDFSSQPLAEMLANWPQDSGLRVRGVQSGDDQPFLGDGARTGTYLDEIHLNKRAARFTLLALVFAGSMHLADTRNTFNLDATAMRPGDVMLWRWQQTGVGHTMLTMRVDPGPGDTLQVQSVFGNLPPDQPIWDNAVKTAHNYANEEAGGLGADGTNYAAFGGGLKRFRVAKNVGGRWMNTWMNADEASWINSTDHDKLHARVEQTEKLLGQLTPEEHRDLLVSIIADKREHLRKLPASCSARIKREEAFDGLYALGAEHFSMTPEQVDETWRQYEDYVFAELEYEKSKTCCWNATTPAMFQTIMDLNTSLREAAEADGTCVDPIVFKAVDGDYDVFRQFRSDGWVSWSAGEACPQSSVANDAEAEHDFADWCAR